MVRRALVFTLFFATVLSSRASAQPGDRRLNMKAQVLDAVFPLEVAPTPYFLKMVLRFGDTDTQLAIVVYPGRKTEVIRYRLAGMGPGDLQKFVSKAVADNSAVRPRDIAVRLKLDVTRSPVDYASVNRAIDELKTIRISPALPTQISVDFSEFEFWCDTWQELVHYVIVSPFQDEPTDALGKWMLKFRATAEEWLKGNAGPPRGGAR